MADKPGYWTGTRLSRRTALQGAAAAGGGVVALSLVGCGGSDSPKPTAGSSAPVVDSTKGKPGGTLKVYVQSYPGNFSPVFTNSTQFMTGFSHSSLLQHAWGVQSVDPFDFYKYEPDAARSLPEQPDDTTLIFKIRPDVKFHNGRTMTVDDVKYSIDRVANDEKSVYRQVWQYYLDHTETPDRETFVVKTKFPFAEALVEFAGNQNGYILAKEYEEGPNAANGIMGAGPFIFVQTTAPVFTTFKKNPEYHQKPFPYVDSLEVLTATDAARRNADFISRQVHMPFRSSTEEAATLRKERPDAKELTWEFASPSITTRADKAPFNDKRVRQALNMSINRKKIRDGLTLGFGRDDQFFTISFQKLFGFREPKDLPQAKLWDYNPAEAKKLLAAAGITSPIEAALFHYDAAPAGQWFPDTATLIETDWKEQGIANVKDDTRTQSVFSPIAQTGSFDSMCMFPNNGFPQGPEFVSELKDQLYFDPVTGKSQRNSAWVNNTQLNALADKQIRQLKIEDRKATYREMEPIMAEEAYRINLSTVTRSYFWDPSLANANMIVVQGSWKFMAKWWFA